MNITIQNAKIVKRLILCVCLAFATVAANAREKGKFPYVGQWMKNIPSTTGGHFVMKYTFDKEGKCVLSVMYPEGRWKNWPCSYVMQGKSALVSYTSFNAAKTEKSRRTQRFWLTPLNKGTNLFYREIDLSYYKVIDKKSQWYTRKLTGKFQMSKVRKP